MARTKKAGAAVGQPRVTRRTGETRPRGLMAFRLIHGLHHEGSKIYAPKGVDLPDVDIEGDILQSFERMDKKFPGRFILIDEQQDYPESSVYYNRRAAKAAKAAIDKEKAEKAGAEDEGALEPDVTEEDKEVDLQAMTKKEIKRYARDTYGVHFSKLKSKAEIILEVQELEASRQKAGEDSDD